MSDEGMLATVAALEATLAPHAATVHQRPNSTIIPPHGTPDTAQRRALANLGHIQAEALAAGITLEGTLGSGGMGIVHLATQRSLGRKVAVKTLRSEHTADAAVLALLQEAWVTGTLEHPNVLPVYDIEADADGRPMVVLKRIEGEAWSTFLRDPGRIELEQHDEPLVWHLGVFTQVCNAVRFAHGRGILHRDLKPDNVMIGAYGEVYLLDWGIAVSLTPDDSGRLPGLRDANAVAGTPAYMAPEMMAGDASKLSVLTDVYLLGAVLFEILVGRAPHRVGSLGELVRCAMSPPQLPDDVPGEIADVVRKAMNPDPSRRYASVDALLDAVHDFLRHRGSLQLAARADVSRKTLLQRVAAEADDAAAREDIYDLLAECRFGYREALAGWADNPRATQGWRQTVLAVIDWELARDDAGAAAALATELSEVPDEVRARIDEAMAGAARQREELQRHRQRARQYDTRIGARTRTGLVMMFGTFFVGLPIFGYVNQAWYERPGTMIWFPLVMLGFLLAAWIWGRESLMKTAINRRLMASVAVMFVVEVTFGVTFHLVDVPIWTQELVHIAIAVLMTALLAIHLDRVFWVPAAAYAVALVLSGPWLELRLLWFAGGNVVLTLTLVRAWAPRTEELKRISAS